MFACLIGVGILILWTSRFTSFHITICTGVTWGAELEVAARRVYVSPIRDAFIVR